MPAEHKNLYNEIENQNALLESICQMQNEYLKQGISYGWCEDTLSNLLHLTDSKFGFICELSHKKDGTPYLNSHVITNIAWSDETRKFYEVNKEKGLEFFNFESIWGQVFKTGKPYISNNPDTDRNKGGYPKEAGHPQLEKFLGIPIKGKDNEVIGIMAVANNPNGYTPEVARFLAPFVSTYGILMIQDRLKQAEEDKNKWLLTTLINAIPDLVWLKDKEGVYIKCNKRFEDFFGHSESEIVGKTDYDFVEKELADFFRHNDKLAMNAEKPTINEEEITFAVDGHSEILETIKTALTNAKNEKIGVLGIGRDFTKHKKAEQALKESEENFKSIVENSTNLFYRHDVNHELTYLSPQIKDILGYEVEEAKGLWMELATDNPINEIGFKNTIKAIETGERQEVYDLELLHNNGSKVLVEVREVPIVKNGKTIEIVGALVDVTEKREKEQKLKESERKFKLLADNTSDWEYWLDENNEYVFISSNCERITGYSPEDFCEKPELLNELVRDDYKEEVSNHYSEKERTKPLYTSEFPIINKSSEEVWIEHSCSPVFDEDGRFIGRRGNNRDITDKKKAELELIKAKEKAEESDRLKSAFLTNMSHEIRTPMNGILGFSELLRKPDLSDEKQAQFIEIIGQSGQRMLNTINSIIDLSKIESGLVSVNISRVDVNRQIESLHEFFLQMAESKGLQLLLNKGLASNEAIIKTDMTKLNSIVTNLVNNAIKFSDKGSIEFGYEAKGEFLEFFVKDTGTGIPEDRLDAIFGRFIKADIEDKHAYQGSGLGLAISKSYVEMLGGKIWVESGEGKGTTFYFTLPYTKESKNETGIGSDESDKIEGGITEGAKKRNLKILVAEDDEVSYLLLTETLMELSAEPIHAINGKEAIKLCYKHPDIDLVLMDIKMPEMGGYEATAKIRQFNKDVVIIAQTAYGLSGDREKAIEAGCNDYISKPIDEKRLLEVIRKHCR